MIFGTETVTKYYSVTVRRCRSYSAILGLMIYICSTRTFTYTHSDMHTWEKKCKVVPVLNLIKHYALKVCGGI
jgi:hypothetical protein